MKGRSEGRREGRGEGGKCAWMIKIEMWCPGGQGRKDG
jgi:hypothetical protein